MKVLFQTRTNVFDAPGGDLIQMNKTKEYLEKLGVTVDISLELEPDLSGYNIVHLFNLMDPQDIYCQMVNARKQNKKIVLSTIYGLYTEFERKARGGFFQKLANILSPYQIGYIKILARYVFEGRLHKGILRMALSGYYNQMKEIVESTSVLLPNSESEMMRIAKEFKLKNYNYVNVPNAIDKNIFQSEATLSKTYEKYKDCILCVARIEGRKGTLNLIRALKNTGYKLVFVGKTSSNQKGYVEQVQKEAGENVHFLGAVPHEELLNLYRMARVHALISWMETPGLSSLEAAAVGCNIVVTRKGDTYDYFMEDAIYCEPDDLESIRAAVEKAYNTPSNKKLKNRILSDYNWEKTAQKTLEGYRMALQ